MTDPDEWLEAVEACEDARGLYDTAKEIAADYAEACQRIAELEKELAALKSTE